jgi:hypothetical protein
MRRQQPRVQLIQRDVRLSLVQLADQSFVLRQNERLMPAHHPGRRASRLPPPLKQLDDAAHADLEPLRCLAAGKAAFNRPDNPFPKVQG